MKNGILLKAVFWYLIISALFPSLINLSINIEPIWIKYIINENKIGDRFEPLFKLLPKFFLILFIYKQISKNDNQIFFLFLYQIVFKFILNQNWFHENINLYDISKFSLYMSFKSTLTSNFLIEAI